MADTTNPITILQIGKQKLLQEIEVIIKDREAAKVDACNTIDSEFSLQVADKQATINLIDAQITKLTQTVTTQAIDAALAL
ncbi:MAG: hypothetical protein WCP97_00495 [bacterium]